MTREVKLLVGIPASGKSTWIKQEVARLEDDHRTACVVSRDYIRFSMRNSNDEDYFSHEKEVFSKFVRQINEAMELGFDTVFIDATHINPISRKKVLSRLLPDPNTSLIIESFPIDTKTALARNAKRKGLERVPDNVIKNMQKNFKLPCMSEFADNLYGFRQIILRCHGGK